MTNRGTMRSAIIIMTVIGFVSVLTYSKVSAQPGEKPGKLPIAMEDRSFRDNPLDSP